MEDWKEILWDGFHFKTKHTLDCSVVDRLRVRIGKETDLAYKTYHL